MKTDPCLYIWHAKQGALYCVISTNVDDLKITGRTDKVKFLIDLLEKEFGESKKDKEFEHCGIVHYQDKGGNILILMDHYITQLSFLPLPKNVNLGSDCSETNAAPRISLLGGVAWTVNTRADVAVFVGALLRVARSPKYVHLKRLNVVWKFIKKHRVANNQEIHGQSPHCGN